MGGQVSTCSIIKKLTKTFKGNYPFLIKSTEIRVYLKLTVIKYDFPLKESPSGHNEFSFFINLNRLGFDDVITLIKMELT